LFKELKMTGENKNLIQCKDCGKEVSKNAKLCPHCGANPVKNTYTMTIVIVVLFGLWYIGSTPSKSPSITQSSQAITGKEAVKDNWTFHTDKSEMDSSKSVYISTVAINSLQKWLGTIRPTLVLRCYEGKTEVVFEAETNLQPEIGNYNQATVRVRFDEGKPSSQLWSESSEGTALFARKPINLINQIEKSKVMKIEFTPFNVPPQIAEFKVSGLSKHLPELKKTCGW
jgi:hypothetical protein